MSVHLTIATVCGPSAPTSSVQVRFDSTVALSPLTLNFTVHAAPMPRLIVESSAFVNTTGRPVSENGVAMSAHIGVSCPDQEVHAPTNFVVWSPPPPPH